MLILLSILIKKMVCCLKECRKYAEYIFFKKNTSYFFFLNILSKIVFIPRNKKIIAAKNPANKNGPKSVSKINAFFLTLVRYSLLIIKVVLLIILF